MKARKRASGEGGSYIVVLIVRQDRIHLDADQSTSLVGPCAGNIAHCVATTAEDESRETEATHKVHAVGMAAHAQIEASETIT
jgi:hypothetical protein